MTGIGERIHALQQEISLLASDRSITLVCVSKNQPVESIQEAYAAGVRDFGESRVQEFEAKRKQLPDDIRWHMIGSLQKNKVRKAIGCFSLIHSIDSLGLAEKISSESCLKNINTPILLEVNTSGESTKHGFLEEELFQAFEAVMKLPQLSVRGLMTMAAPSRSTLSKRPPRSSFQQLHVLKRQLEAQFCVLLPELSMGMSDDFRIALQEGATIIRIGSRIFNPTSSEEESNF